eukprot:2606950-Amphidinium_carterae.2
MCLTQLDALMLRIHRVPEQARVETRVGNTCEAAACAPGREFGVRPWNYAFTAGRLCSFKCSLPFTATLDACCCSGGSTLRTVDTFIQNM